MAIYFTSCSNNDSTGSNFINNNWRDIEWKYYKSTLDAIRELKTSGYKILVIEQTDLGLPVQQFEPGENLKFALVFGNEINGVDEEILAYADSCLDIPQFGTKHSLNVSVVIGIILWEVLRKIKKI